MAIYPASTIARFWSKVDVHMRDTRCWEWRGSRHGKGYGHIRIGRGVAKAHRVAWEIFHNERLAPGLMVCHLCDNPACCNPNHLWVGTNGDNLMDRQSKQRQARGETHGHSSLNDEAVLEILSSAESNETLAKRFGVTKSGIRSVRSGRAWRHLAGRVKAAAPSSSPAE